MERRKESLSDIKLCRFCLTQDTSLTSLYDRSRDPIVTLPLKIMACVSIEVFPSDKMPSYICERCRTFMDLCYDFKQICRRADESCLQFVQKGVPISAVNWPPSLTKIFQLTKMASPINTVVQGGATIQVTAQDMLENDDAEEETFNVKIDASGDVTQSGPSHINATISAERESTSASNKAAVTKGVMVRVRRRSAGLGSWPCEECDSSFPLHQLLEIHMGQRHRVRNAQCTQCEAKFFSKYDLMTHQLRHTNETPFQCVACGNKFKRLILLKRHEKMVHSDLPRHLCTNCPVTFLSIEELQAHQKRHEGYFSRQHVCTICDRKFHTKGTLQRHRDVVHGRKHFSCEYCPHRFPTISKLTRHVRAHAGDRAYPCKYCSKSFMKSHHYTRHLRLKHEEQVREARGVTGEGEFRCEQCNESFSTQDDLYYHSAIHATQNLICPLCQEKFENVDAVTAHIRTHVNGIEFMCEYCELVFTSKEKLDMHMSAAHDDEIASPQVNMDDSSMEADAADADADDDDEDNGLNVTEEDGHMVVEIKKAEGYMLRKDIEVGQTVNTNSEDSEIEISYADTGVARAESSQPPVPTKSEATSSKSSRPSATKNSDRISILRKAEAIKRKATEKENPDVPQKKERVDSTTNNASSSDKSLRMLEKELQELKRTNIRNDGKPMRSGEAKSKRQPAHTSTPKLRSVEEKKSQVPAKVQATVEKKAADRRATTKDKVAKDNKEARNTVTSTKEEKSVSSTKDDKPSTSAKDEKSNKKGSAGQKGTFAKEEASTDNQLNISTTQETKKAGKEDKSSESSKDAKNKATLDVPSTSSNAEVASTSSSKELLNADKEHKINISKDEGEIVKNGDTSGSEDNVVRRSTRPSKIKNYASMIRDRTRLIRDEEDTMENSDDSDTADVKEADVHTSPTLSRRRSVPKRQKPATPLAPPANAPVAQTGARRRGRPRKEPTSTESPDTPQPEEAEAEKEITNTKEAEIKPAEPLVAPADSQIDAASSSPTSTDPQNPLANMIVSPTGQTLKKVPVKALPPGVMPLPLPLSARRDICQMQIGKKMVKVQKIIMTKAEVEAMAKKGLLELKDGNMLLKAGVKLPETDPAAVRSGLVSQGPIRKVSAIPTRCSFDGEEQ